MRINGLVCLEFVSAGLQHVAQYAEVLHCSCDSFLATSNLRWKPLVVQLFASSQLESEDFYKMEDLANHMGLFLQKTNIIRDYLEDINEEPAPRCLTLYCTC